MSPLRTFVRPLAAAAVLAGGHAPAAAQQNADRPVLELRPCHVPRFTEELRCGTYHAPENRDVRGGRTIPMQVIVVPARGSRPRPDPIFFVVGGPGQTATELVGVWAASPLREEREVVVVDQRGTSPAHALNCRLPGSADNLQGYLDPLFDPETFRRCRAELAARADLTRYTTLDYVHDLDDVRRALGYERINLQGASYGSRVVLFYLREYPAHARTGFATGVYPASMRSPLYHAQDSQAALDSIFALCARDTGCSRAFPRLRREFEETMERLRREPARVTVTHPTTGTSTPITMDAEAFAEGVRMMMYQWEHARRLPLLLHRAHGGDDRAFAEAALAGSAGVRQALRFGVLMSAICSEDMPRITEDDIVRETAGTFLGDQRVRTQKAACDEWPRRPLPPGTNDPVVSDIPVLLVSGAYDPATAARWGTLAAQTLSNSLHVIMPASHTAGSPCADRMRLEFLNRGTVQGLDTSCVREMRLPPFVLSEAGSQD